MMQAFLIALSSRAAVRGRIVPGSSGRLAGLLTAAVLVLGWSAAPASAQTVVREDGVSIFSPYIGATTGGDTNTKGLTFGFSTAYIGDANWGGEFDLAHSNDFNRDYEDSGLTTMMLNLMFAPQATRQLRPYVLGGVGLIRTRACTANCVREVSETDFGLDAGGGALWALSDAWGVRGDVRYFRYVNTNRDVPRLDNGPFDFWRIAVGGTYSW